MKCNFCGGEVPSQSLKCPYCGSDNPEGVAFQKERQEKIERNESLEPVVLKKKTPELAQKMLTRVIIISMAANVLLFIVCIGIVLLAEYEKERVVREGSQAALFYEEFSGSAEYFDISFFENSNEYIEMIENGEMPDENKVSILVGDAYAVFRTMDELEDDVAEDLSTYIYAFFAGYIGLAEEDMVFLEPDEDGEYAFFMDSDAEDRVVARILEKQKEGLR